MAKHRLSLPPTGWPDDLRAQFERHHLSPAQRKRLGQALGRWLSISEKLGADPRSVSRETWTGRTEHLSRGQRNAVRQSLAIAFPDFALALYEGQAAPRAAQPTRVRLNKAIARNLKRFPPDWRALAEPLLYVDELGIVDGLLIKAWAPSTIVRCIEAAARHFDFCRASGLPVDITPGSVRASLRAKQARVEAGDLRLGAVVVDLGAATMLASAICSERPWSWLKSTHNRMKKMANRHGSRNAARAVDAAELRAAGQQLLDRADAARASARNLREFRKAHTLARTALMMILMSEAPLRIKTCAELELDGNLPMNLQGLFVSAAATKERATDLRVFSRTLVDALTRYVKLHRAVIAAPGERRLFVGLKGGAVKASQLSKCLGDFTQPVFGVRVTPHAVRHSVGNFIVATAPEEASLASMILNHQSDAVTPTYTQRADQIVASRRLAEATEKSARALAADTLPTQRGKTGRRRPPVRAVRQTGAAAGILRST